MAWPDSGSDWLGTATREDKLTYERFRSWYLALVLAHPPGSSLWCFPVVVVALPHLLVVVVLLFFGRPAAREKKVRK